MLKKDPQARFWVEAQVSLAKSAVLLANAESDINNGNCSSAAVNVYYSLFHLGLAFMWLLPTLISTELREELVARRDSGDELPNKLISHKKVEEFLCSQRETLPTSFIPLFTEALALRLFASYGPRVTYDGEEAFVGPCRYRPADVERVIRQAPQLFIESLIAIWPKTAYEGQLGLLTVDHAVSLLTDSQFPYKKWFAPELLERARQLINQTKAANSTGENHS